MFFLIYSRLTCLRNLLWSTVFEQSLRDLESNSMHQLSDFTFLHLICEQMTKVCGKLGGRVENEKSGSYSKAAEPQKNHSQKIH